MVVAKQRRRAGRSGADPTMSPAAARKTFPADSMMLDDILRLLEERDVPSKAVDRIMQLHFSEAGISMAKADEIVTYLRALLLRDGVEQPFL